jgi:hypothetical protein
MAKVYDALKQVEVERSRQRLMEYETARSVDVVLARLDAFEEAARRLPEVERRLMGALDDRAAVAERELGKSLTLLGNQIRQDLASLNRRVTWVLATLVVGLLVLLLAS